MRRTSTSCSRRCRCGSRGAEGLSSLRPTQAFRYYRPERLPEALELLQAGDCLPLAGGSGTEIGTGAVAVGAAAIAAEELGLPLDRVRVVSRSTDAGPFDGGSKGSRTLYGVGNAARAAAAECARIVAEHVAEELEASADDVVLRGGRVEIAGSPERSFALAEAVRGAQSRSGPIVGNGRFEGQQLAVEGAALSGLVFDFYNEPTFHCHGAEIELDEETGRIDVLRYVAAHDVGAIVNPLGARGQVEGGVVQGLGYALYEKLDVGEDGIVRNDSFVDYRLPTIADVPRSIEAIFIEDHPAPTGPHGAKGIGEAPVILPAAAVGSALRNAVGAQPDELPLDAIRVADFLDRLES